MYDACNRLVRVKRRVDAETVIATYSYQGDTRRCRKVVTNCGIETVPNDGGNTSINFYYGGLAQGGVGRLPARWSIFETRNGSNQTTWQYVWGTQYIDEIVLADRNGDATASNDCNPDVTAQGESSETPADQRYFYHQEPMRNDLVALTEYDADPNSTVNGRVAERYRRAAHLESRPLVFAGTVEPIPKRAFCVFMMYIT